MEIYCEIYKYSDGAFTEIPAKNKNGEAIEWLGGQRGDFAIADFDGDGNQDFILGVENQNLIRHGVAVLIILVVMAMEALMK